MRPLSRFAASSGFALALTFILTFKGLNRDACFPAQRGQDGAARRGPDPGRADGHGSDLRQRPRFPDRPAQPRIRVQQVRYPWSNPKHSGCGKIASQSSSWMSNAVGGVLDNHQDYIPDGLLCAGGKEDWKEIDGNYDWPTTVLTPGADGKLTFKYQQTAPHITKYFRTYISKRQLRSQGGPALVRSGTDRRFGLAGPSRRRQDYQAGREDPGPVHRQARHLHGLAA